MPEDGQKMLRLMSPNKAKVKSKKALIKKKKNGLKPLNLFME
jgi:hypothetical protein